MFKSEYLNKVYAEAEKRNPGEPEFLQAVRDVLESLEPVIAQDARIEKLGIMERMVEPERMITFRVSWVDDNGNYFAKDEGKVWNVNHLKNDFVLK